MAGDAEQPARSRGSRHRRIGRAGRGRHGPSGGRDEACPVRPVHAHAPAGPRRAVAERPIGRLRCRYGSPLFPGARRERDGRQHDTVRRGPARPRGRRDRHRPAHAHGRGRRAGLPPGGPERARRRRRRPLVRRPGRQPGRRRAGRARTRRSSCSATRSTRRARPSGPRRGSRTGRRSAARCCCCPASPTRSPGSTCCGPRCRRSAAAPSSSPTRGSGHTLKPVLDDVLDRTAAFLASARQTERPGVVGPADWPVSCALPRRRATRVARTIARYRCRRRRAHRGPHLRARRRPDRADVRRAHRVVPVGRSSIASPGWPP